MMGLAPFLEETPESLLCLSISLATEPSKKAAVYKPEREPSPEPGPPASRPVSKHTSVV